MPGKLKEIRRNQDVSKNGHTKYPLSSYRTSKERERAKVETEEWPVI